MPFEWQKREEAARTLGVNVQTLQQWIDSGHAPSRSHEGGVEVLIEFPDEDEEEQENENEETPPSSDADLQGDARRPARSPDEDESEAAEPRTLHAEAEPEAAAEPTAELVSHRELRMAGGMVAAWQRLAETAESDLARSRRLALIAWSLLGLLAILSAAGLWWAATSITRAEGDARSSHQRLQASDERVDQARQRADQLRDRLTEARANLAELEERARLSASQNEKLAEQQRLTRSMAQSRTEADRTLAATLRDTIDRQADRINRLEKKLTQIPPGNAPPPATAPEPSASPSSSSSSSASESTADSPNP